MVSFPYEAVSQPQSLDLIFRLSDLRKGNVAVSVQPNLDSEQCGCDLLFPNDPKSAFNGFPICEAKVRSTGAKGYGSMYGWIQMVQISDAVLTPEDAWEMDPIPITQDLNTPFCWFGAEPTLFDGPMRKGVKRLDWKCHSFLGAIDDCLISKDVRPVLGFEWGFWIEDGSVSVKKLRELDLEQWDGHLPMLKAKFEGWKFRDHQDRQG